MLLLVGVFGFFPTPPCLSAFGGPPQKTGKSKIQQNATFTLIDSQALGKRLFRQGITSFDISLDDPKTIQRLFNIIMAEKPPQDSTLTVSPSDSIIGRASDINISGYSYADTHYIMDNLQTLYWISEQIGLRTFDPRIFPGLRNVIELVNSHSREPIEELADLCDTPAKQAKGPFVDGLFRFDLPKLQSVIDRFGFTPIIEIARCDLHDRTVYPYNHSSIMFALTEITDLIHNYGIEIFVDHARQFGAGKTFQIFAVLDALKHLINSRDDFTAVPTLKGAERCSA